METKLGYICSTDFEHHIENDLEGTVIYPSIKALSEKKGCIGFGDYDCRIYQVEVKVIGDATICPDQEERNQ